MSVYVRRAVSFSLAVSVLAFTGVTAAYSIPPPDGLKDQLTFVGSDTTSDVTGSIAADWNANKTVNTDKDVATNVPAFAPAPGTTVTVAADANCASQTWAITPLVASGGQRQAPTGGSAGKSALISSVNAGDGCVDVARVATPRSSTDPSTLEYYAFARDALSWSAFTGGHAPKDLSLADLKSIYNCTKTNWSQVTGGTAGNIIRYFPLSSASNRSFFISNILGFDPTTISSSSCPAVKISSAQNDGTVVDPADRPNAIQVFSASQWIAQANGAVTDVRAGSYIGSIDKAAPVGKVKANGTYAPSAKVYGETSTFPGARYIYHVVDITEPQYDAALRVIGYDAAGGSRLCTGVDAKRIKTFGFLPLPKNASGLTCRKS